MSGNVVSVLSPTMTNEVLVSWSRLTLDNTWRDPSKVSLSTYPELAGYSQGFFPNQSPYLPLNIITSGWGQGGPGNLWAPAMDVFAYNDALQFSDKLTKIAGSHGLKFGISVERGQKQQNFENRRVRRVPVRPVGDRRHRRPGGRPADGPSGQLQRRAPRIPQGEWRYWNTDVFAQDSWKIKPNLTLEFGIRAGFWTNNGELNDFGGLLRPGGRTTRNAGTFLDPGTYQSVNGWQYASTGRRRRRAAVDNRSPFAMPRVNLAWDIDGQGNNVLRGGFGMFYNRNMGNLEYATLRVPPISYRGRHRLGRRLEPRRRRRADLRHAAASSTGARASARSTLDTLNPDSNKWPKTYSYSVSYARRIFFNQVIEAAYVGTKGRDLVSRRQLNAVPLGSLLSGTAGTSDLSVPVNRVALDSSLVNSRRPYPSLAGVQDWSFEGDSNYNSLQVTLSRQTGRRLQYFAAYTLARSKGTTSGNGEYGFIDPFDPSRTYGVLPEDRTHIFNLSWNAFLPDGARGGLDNAVMRGVLNGWQLSGISTLASGVPVFLGFGGQAASDGVTQAIFGTPDIIGNPGPGGGDRGGLSPVYTCDPRLGGNTVGEKLFDINCIGIPAFGDERRPDPAVQPAHADAHQPRPDGLQELRHPRRPEDPVPCRVLQPVQPGVGHHQLGGRHRPGAEHRLQRAAATACPTASAALPTTSATRRRASSYDQNTIDNFGKVNLKRGRRVIEFVLKYCF